jgi:hypothetical protein
MITEDQVKLFCKVLTEKLNADFWGSIEPEVFENIGDGNFTGGEDGFVTNKYSQEEMAEAVPSMYKAIKAALVAVSDSTK